MYKLRHILTLNLSSLLVSASAVFGKVITINPAQLIFFRSFIAGVFLALYLKYRGVNLGQRFRQYWAFFILSGFLLGVHWVMLFWAVQVSTVSIAILAVFTFPVITTLLEPLFFKMRLVWFNLLTAGLVCVGIAFLVPEYTLENNISLGVFLGVASAVLIAVRNLLCKRYADRVTGPEMMFFQVMVSAILLVASLFFEKPDLNVANVSYLLAMGLITTAIGHTLFVYCLKFFPTSTASIIVSIQPLYGILLAMIFLHEIPNRQVIWGGVLIVGTVVLENLKAAYWPARVEA